MNDLQYHRLPNLSFKKDMIKTGQLLSSKRLVLNALGTKFEIRTKTLEAFPPDSRLGKLKDFRHMSEPELGQICDEYDLENMEFYFERDPEILRMILNFYITGQFHLVSNLCEIFVENEFNYWQVQWKDMRVCCRSYQQIGYEAKLREIASEKVILKVAREQTKSDQGYKQKLWTLVSNPNSSKTAMVINFSNRLLFFAFSVVLKLSFLFSLGLFHSIKYHPDDVASCLRSDNPSRADNNHSQRFQLIKRISLSDQPNNRR